MMLLISNWLLINLWILSGNKNWKSLRRFCQKWDLSSGAYFWFKTINIIMPKKKYENITNIKIHIHNIYNSWACISQSPIISDSWPPSAPVSLIVGVGPWFPVSIPRLVTLPNPVRLWECPLNSSLIGQIKRNPSSGWLVEPSTLTTLHITHTTLSHN